MSLNIIHSNPENWEKSENLDNCKKCLDKFFKKNPEKQVAQLEFRKNKPGRPKEPTAPAKRKTAETKKTMETEEGSAVPTQRKTVEPNKTLETEVSGAVPTKRKTVKPRKNLETEVAGPAYPSVSDSIHCPVGIEVGTSGFGQLLNFVFLAGLTIILMGFSFWALHYFGTWKN